MSKESFPQNNTQETPPRVEHISDAEKRALELLLPKHKEFAVNMDDFEDVYSKEEIDHDKQSVQNKMARMENLDSPSYQRAQLLETILAEQIELSDWFGSNVTTIIPAEYDDLFNGIDLTTEFEQDGSFQYAAMGIDVTSGGRPVQKKLAIIKDHIRDGSLTHMKYFRSERNNDKKPNEQLPQFVIGADARTINELSNLRLLIYDFKHPSPDLSTEDRQELREKAKEAQEKLANHRSAILILEELEAQLEVFTEYARLINSSAIEKKYRGLLNLVRDILSHKTINKSDQIKNGLDNVYGSIKKELETFLSD